jgi:hypothetical protein
MNYFVKLREAYAVTKQDVSAVSEALVTKHSCGYGVWMELHSYKGRNF